MSTDMQRMADRILLDICARDAVTLAAALRDYMDQRGSYAYGEDRNALQRIVKRLDRQLTRKVTT